MDQTTTPLRQPKPNAQQKPLAAEFVPQNMRNEPVPVRTSSAPPADQPDGQPRPIYQPYKAGGYPMAAPRGGRFVPRPYAGYVPRGQNPYAGANANNNPPPSNGGAQPRMQMRSNAQQFVPRGPPMQGQNPYYMPYMGHPGQMHAPPRFMPTGTVQFPTQPQPTGAAPAQRPRPVARERKALLIIDPKTNKPIAVTKPVKPSPPKDALEVAAELKAAREKEAANSKEFSPVGKQPEEAAGPSMMFGSIEVEGIPESEADKPTPPEPVPVIEEPEKKDVETVKTESTLSSADEEDEAEEEEEEVAEVEEEEEQTIVSSIPLEPNTWKNKRVYTVKSLLLLRKQCKALPAAALEEGSGWDTMEVDPEGIGPILRQRGSRSQSGWERGKEHGQRKGGNEWQRSQDLPRRQSDRRGGRGGGRGEPEFDGPVKPLERSDNRWVPVKSTTHLDEAVKLVQGIMNKMTREKFDRLSKQLCEMEIKSLEMLRAVITLIFDKALGEPHFCDMYADLCVRLEGKWLVWSFLQIVRDDDTKKFYWTTIDEPEEEVVGPFSKVSDVLESIDSNAIFPIPAPKNLKLSQMILRSNKLVKIWKEESSQEFYWSGTCREDLTPDTALNGVYDTSEEAQHHATKSTSFKRIILNSCQEEFQKDNVYEELDEELDEEELEERRGILKRRMLGNIRFIGELYKKGMLGEHIMHGCIMKLLECSMDTDPTTGYPTQIVMKGTSVPDEENLESLSKLLTTIGKKLDNKNSVHYVDLYFQVLSQLSLDKRIGTRIRFMLKDVIELRQSNWTPRRKELKQKTLEEIRKDAEKEHRSAAMDRRASSSASQRNGPGPKRNLSRQHSASRHNDFPSRSRDPDNVTLAPRGRFGGGRSSNPAPTNRSKGPKLDHAALKKLLLPILTEYFTIGDVAEVTTCLKETKEKSYDAMEQFVKESVRLAMEAKEDERTKILDLLTTLVTSQVLSSNDLSKGVAYLMELGPDLKCDVPKLHLHMSRFVGAFMMLEKSNITLDYILERCNNSVEEDAWLEFVDCGLLANVVGEIVSSNAIETKMKSFVNVLAILPSRQRSMNDLKDWMMKYNQLEKDSILELNQAIHIAELMETEPVDKVIKWVEDTVSPEMRKNHRFAQHAVTFLLQMCTSTLPPSNYCDLLRGLCFGIECEVSCLFGIQQCFESRIKQLFQFLHEEHIISMEALKKWKATPANALLNRQAALQQVKDLIK